jgi:holo-[acyl-carrier protein] synthase
MIRRIGVDLVDLKRFSDPPEDRLVRRILSSDEIAFYETITDSKRRITYLGGRFAAKEALFKALPPRDGKANYTDITISADNDGKSVVRSTLIPQGDVVHLSISHTDSHATAFVILESDVT